MNTLLTALVLAELATGAPELSSQAQQPYQLVVAIRFSDDPLMTRPFKNSVQRQVQDQLTNYFGPLAAVKVTLEHPLLEKLEENSLEEFKLSAEELSALKLTEKVFLTTVGYQDGAYRIGWRQFDGDLQLLGGWRTRETPDRQWVAKAVCLAVKDDFAPVALVKPAKSVAGSEPRPVELDFRGAAFKQQLAGCLNEHTYLQPYWVIKERDGALTRMPIPDTVLRIDPKDPLRRATVITNRRDPWQQTARVVGFQAIKLNTQSGRLRLRLVDVQSGAPANRCIVSANTAGFAALSDQDRLPAPDRDGTVVSLQPFSHLAYVRISQGGGAEGFEIPVPITGDWNERVCRVPIDKAAGEKSEWERQMRYLAQDVLALQATLNELVKEANRLHGEKRYEDSLAAARLAAKTAASHHKTAQLSFGELADRAKELKIARTERLQRAADQLAKIAEQEQSLMKKAEDLDQLIQKTDAQNRANVLVGLGNEALAKGDVEEALAKFELALAEQADQPQLQERFEQLKESWRIKSPAHEKSRKYVYDLWPQMEVTELAAQLPEAEQHFTGLSGLGDKLTITKLLAAGSEHLDALSALVDQLESRASDEDKKEHEKYAQLLEKLALFQQQVAQWLESQ